MQRLQSLQRHLDCFITIGDLLLRHRRRCQRPNKPLTRRKACDVCVQAKAKCDYNQPTCSRCAKRGTSCHYLSGNTTDSNGSNPDESNGHQTADMDCSPVIVTSSVGNLAELADVSPAWSSQVPLWPLPFDDSDINLQGSASPDMSTFAEVNRILGIADSDNSTPTSTSQQSISRSMSNWLPNANNLITTSATISELTPEDSVASLDGGLDITSAPANYPTIPPYNPWTPVQLLGQYPTLLLYDDFSSPFIHRAMYNEQVSDMTTLPRTSMAICCGGGIRSNDSTRYIKRAIDAERRNLIEDFVRGIRTLCPNFFADTSFADFASLRINAWNSGTRCTPCCFTKY